MRFRITLLVTLLLFGATVAKSQDTATDNPTVKIKEPLHLFSFADPHSPKKASIYAAVLPGLGQLYNRKYWKIPIVYASLGVSTYFMLENRKQMRKLNTQFRAAYAINKDTTLDANLLFKRDEYRRFRDLSILAMTGFYALQIIDATVDAHFFKLDIDQSLEASIRPSSSHFLQFRYHF